MQIGDSIALVTGANRGLGPAGEQRRVMKASTFTGAPSLEAARAPALPASSSSVPKPSPGGPAGTGCPCNPVPAVSPGS
jgi:hypothetical protein